MLPVNEKNLPILLLLAFSHDTVVFLLLYMLLVLRLSFLKDKLEFNNHYRNIYRVLNGY